MQMKLFLRNNYKISLLESALLEVKEKYIATQNAYKAANKSIAESLHVEVWKIETYLPEY